MGGERSEITPKCGQVDRASRINDPKLGEVTTRCEGRGESDIAERNSHHGGVVFFINAVLEGGQTVRVLGGDVAEQGRVRIGRATMGAVLLDYHLSLCEGPSHGSVIWGSA
jgi:hypothetical protein